MKAKSKYILFVFVGIIVMLLAGIFVSIPQAKTELIYADAASDCSTLGHDWEDEWSSDATMHWHACSRCGAKKEISLGLPEDRLKHTPGPAATCTEDQVCTVCGRVLKEALGHEWGDEWSSDSSMHWHGCSRCDAKYESTIGIPDDKLKHTAGSAATCTTPQTCTVCGFVIKKALGHSEGAPVRENEVPASCAKAGSYDEVVYCSACGDELSREKKTIDSLGHSFTKYVSDGNATCTADGTETAKCDRCDVTDTRTDVGSAAHDWSEMWTTDGTSHWHECSRCDAIKDKANHSGGTATCIKKAACSVCGKEYGSYGSHSYTRSDVESTQSYCPDTKYTCRYCSSYYYSSTGTTSRTLHSLTSRIETEATCTTTGRRRYTCTDCNYTYTALISALGHDWSDKWTTDGTSHWHECTQCNSIKDKATHSGGTATCIALAKCSVCGKSYGSYGSHSYTRSTVTSTSAYCSDTKYTCRYCSSYYYLSTGTTSRSRHSLTSRVETAATCTTAGTRRYTCTDCSYTYTTSISALDHDWSDKWTTDGSSHWHECSRCDEINDKANHSGGTATCIKKAVCSVCRVEYGDFADHVYVESAEEQYLVSAATCTAKAVYYKSCSVCGEAGKETFEYGDPLGHEYGEPAWTWNSYTSATATFTCTRNGCGDKQTVTASGSSITSVVTTPAECEKEGLKTYTAKVTFGGEEYTDTTTEKLEALGHTEGEAVRENEVPASCIVAGSYDEVVYCSVCGDELSREEKVIDALGHDLKHHEAKPATCTEIGWNAYDICTRCDYTTYVEIEALGHTEGEAVRENEVPASCIVAGSYDEVVYCSVCGDELSREEKVIDALGHSFTKYVSDDNATCTEDGTETAKCDRCDVTDTRTDVDSALGHDWSDEWTTDGTSHWHECSRCDEINDKATHSGGIASCIKPAECDVCGIEYGDALGHDLEHHAAKDASCTEIGWAAYDTCTRCDYTTYVEIPAKGHTFGPDATCTEDQVCLECGEVISAASGHIPGPDATCTENQTCSVCGEILTPALGHSFTKYVSDKNATCTEDGTETSKCDRCEVTNTRTDDGSALGHDWSDEWTTDGTSHWHECSRCDEINDKANHSGGAATCIALAKCGICGVEYGDFAEHIYTEKVDEQYLVSAATCTASATYFKSCSVCGEAGEEIFEYGDSLGHEYGEPEWTWEGYTSAAATFTCTRGCGDKQTATASGSSITSVVTTPAECEKEGLKTYTAKVTFGGEEYTDTTTEKLEALGHTEGEAVRENEVPASCIVAGSYDEVVYCSVCGDELSREEKVIDALGHDLKHHEAKPATCTEIGWNAYDTCLRCDYTTYRELAAKGHTPGTSATCTEAQICTVCGTTLTAALGHEFKNGYCVRCGVPEDIAFENAKEDTKSDLDEISQEIKDKIDSSDLPDEVKEGLKVIIDKIISDAKNDVNGALDYDDLNDIIHDAEQKIEDAVQNAEQDDAKTELDEIAQNAKDEIDASDLPDDVKEDLKDKIDEIIGGAKDEVNGELTKEELDRVIEDTKNEIEDAVQNAEKDDAKSELDEIAQNAKEEIDASDLPDDVKEDLKDKIDEIIGGAKDEVNGELTKEELDQVIEDTKNEIEDAVQNAEKDDAKTELDEIAQNAKDEVDASDLPDDVKEDLKDKIDEIIGGAKDEVDGSIDFDDVDQSVEDARQEIEDMILNAEKDEAKSDLDEIVQNAKDEIDSSELSDEGKTELKGKLDEILTSKKEEIGIAMTPEEIEEVLNSARDEIAALTGNLTEVQPDAIPLWPWLIAAGVISAALSAIFAWRHVKSVRAKGRTIGAKSIVTIAVATILIFVVVIGITFLIFAMI